MTGVLGHSLPPLLTPWSPSIRPPLPLADLPPRPPSVSEFSSMPCLFFSLKVSRFAFLSFLTPLSFESFSPPGLPTSLLLSFSRAFGALDTCVFPWQLMSVWGDLAVLHWSTGLEWDLGKSWWEGGGKSQAGNCLLAAQHPTHPQPEGPRSQPLGVNTLCVDNIGFEMHIKGNSTSTVGRRSL